MGKRKRSESWESDASGSDDEHDSDLEVAAELGLLPSAASSAAAGPKVNNVAGLKAALAGMKKDLPWIERLEVVSAAPLNIGSVKDDLKLELAFYGQALAAVTAARGELDRLRVPHRRPDDYFADMLKSDDHMARVKAKLISESKRQSSVEQRRREKDAATFNKQTAAERTKEKAAEKRRHMDSLKQWRKHKDDATRPDLDDVLSGRGGGAAGGAGGAGRDRDRDRDSGSKAGKFSGAKRKGKDKKYGFGGPKRNSKENTTRSTDSMKGFSVARMKGRTGKGSKKGGARPGKRARLSSMGK